VSGFFLRFAQSGTRPTPMRGRLGSGSPPSRGQASPERHRKRQLIVIPAKGPVEKVLIRVVWFWKPHRVRAGLDRDEVVVVTCPQGVMEATGHTPRLCRDTRPVATSGGVWVFQQSRKQESILIPFCALCTVFRTIRNLWDNLGIPDAAWSQRSLGVE
jgi:hypothetical protein